MAELVVENIVKTFGDVYALKGVSFSVKNGEFVVLLGPSGSGKTTALRCVAGLEKPDRGHIFIDGQRVNEMPPADRDIAFVFQNYALYPHLTVFENLAFPLRAVGTGKAEVNERVQNVARILHIEHLLHRRPHHLSSGEMQRVALGRAIIRRPKLFLMDEPLSNLDALLRAEMRAELKRLQKDLGTTTLFVTHDQLEAMSMGDRIAVLDQGQIQQIGSPDEIYHRPANLFVASFVGSPAMNLVPCRLAEENGQRRLIVEDSNWSLPLPPEVARAAQEGRAPSRLVLGIRAEDLSVSLSASDGAVAAEVYVLEPLGAETIVNVLIGPHVLKVRTRPTFTASIRQTVYMTWNQEGVRVFDAQTEKALG
ncbi:MAG: ABC transporter ATP-binding protein [Armatimonadetes bacterium]|nr:ABC transporter ATP-binding protein [Armatimonadota bacterium]MDW8122449.1 ABC transporter ATP-binding protein [Armatimonadota bacterium]